MTRGTRVALALAALLVLSGATPAIAGTLGPLGTAETDEPRDEPTIVAEGFEPDYDPAAVLDRVERLRELPATGAITLHEYDAEENATGDVSDRFGAIRPAGARALQLYSNASTERRQPLGYAVERADSVHVHLLNDSDLTGHGVPQEAVLAHELVHALQFQHGLLAGAHEESLPASGERTTDDHLVVTALIEGDAMWVTEQYVGRYADDDSYSVRDYNRTLARAAWPHSVAGTPYYYGYEFYAATARSPDARSATIEDPPNSTADLLHPGESVERAPLPDPPTLPDDGDLTRYHTDTVGELVVRHALRLNGLSFPRAAAAADGWASDRMAYYAVDGPTGPATHWTTVWADEREAREFAEAWRSTLRDNGAEVTDGTDGERESDAVLSVPASDHAPAVHYVVEREGDVVRITAAPSAEVARRLAAAT